MNHYKLMTKKIPKSAIENFSGNVHSFAFTLTPQHSFEYFVIEKTT